MPEAVAETVARAVRTLRAAHGWSLDSLAARSGVSKGVLVAVEQGRGNPNINTLVKISETLGVPLTRLVQVEDEPLVRVFSPDRHAVLWRGAAGGVGTLLGGSEPRPSVELWTWTIQPGEVHASEAHMPGTREIAFVEEGVLTLTVGDREYEIPAGSAVVFGTDRHSYANHGDRPLRYVLAVMDL